MAEGTGVRCEKCNDTGMVFVQKEGQGPAFATGEMRQFAQHCECLERVKLDGRMRRAHIPGLYRDVELENYETGFKGCTSSQKNALNTAQHFCKETFPGVGGKATGLLLYGGMGVGKTHLAIGILKELIRKGMTGVFYDQNELLSLLRQSYERETSFEESDILGPATDRDVLVMDDLGAMALSDWAKEKLIGILNERYNHDRITVITTNFPPTRSLLGTDFERRPANELQRANSTQTLGDRVTDRMLSRLEQMCVPVSVTGPDMRSGVMKASFS